MNDLGEKRKCKKTHICKKRKIIIYFGNKHYRLSAVKYRYESFPGIEYENEHLIR